MSPLRRTLRFILGWIFIVLGIAGLFLPILQGILFLGIGLGLLAGESPWAQKILNQVKSRYPKQYEAIHHLRQRLDRLWRRVWPWGLKD